MTPVAGNNASNPTAAERGLAEVLGRYEGGARLLPYACSGLSAEQAEVATAPGTLSILQVAVHLLDADLVFAERIKRIFAEDDPILQPFDEDLWIERIPAAGLPLDDAVQLFAANRRWMARIMRRRPPQDFARTGMKAGAGPQTAAQILAYAISHLDHHLRFIYGKRANLSSFIDPRFAHDLTS